MNENKRSFVDLGINESCVERLANIGITSPTPVQERIIGEILEGKSVLFQSETGTGKTFAFVLPILEKINPETKNPQAIIVCPTHELCAQIKLEIQKVCDYKVSLCFGGAPIKRQIESLKEKPQFVIGSLERIKELIFLKKLKLNDSKFLVYDEIDRLSQAEERDFSTDLISLMPKDIQFIGCSATVTENAKKVFENALKNLKEDFQIDLITLPKENVLQEKIMHWAIFAEQRDKIPTLKSIILAENPEKVLVFTGKLDQVENITQKLKYKKIECEGLHAKTDKVERKSIIDRFRSGKIKILVTSDLSARGLDFPNVTHVIQMDLPSNDDFFIHRAGRTGRANQSGINIVIGDAYEMRKYSRLEKKLKIKVYPKILRGGKIYPADYFQDEMNKKEKGV